jgi:hypothetical protein
MQTMAGGIDAASTGAAVADADADAMRRQSSGFLSAWIELWLRPESQLLSHPVELLVVEARAPYEVGRSFCCAVATNGKICLGGHWQSLQQQLF